MTGAAPSAKGLFLATKPKRTRDARQADLMPDLPDQSAPISARDLRDPLDYDPTPFDATRAFLGVEGDLIRAHGTTVWEPAAGGGHMVYELRAAGFDVVASDVVDRGWPGVDLRSFYQFDAAPAPVQVTNPPYNEINARDGHGRWLLHSFDLGLDYIALLLNADWPAARKNGMDAILAAHPPSVEYLCCWKIDFRGGGAPPQRNSWFVWDVKRPAPSCGGWLRRRLFREAGNLTPSLDLGGVPA
ncbi:hypothetical protein N0B44_15690 [Roseibacterium beibuensis]|uniref:Methyltransferase n=1 Tax=[Roseibacterium] beibuensis TaxID=1193142 RepID=A0ABP9L8V7_9RHOB|nr:hypothetical protein [Roseibacterium beibuensis]MCS6624361.1 hypothetical protein [Roseibacterium beibuensis]